HVILTELGGLKSPSVVSIPRTNVAESADVIKKIAITIIVIIDITKPNGNCSSIPKVLVSISKSDNTESPLLHRLRVADAMKEKKKKNKPIPLKSTRKTEDPKIKKIVKHISIGTMRTPAKNSRTVRPREIRAIKVPTNGAQEIQNAQ